MDHINTLRIILEQSKDLHLSINLLIVDLERSFKSVKPVKLHRSSSRCTEIRSAMSHRGQLGHEFNVTLGVKQSTRPRLGQTNVSDAC